MSHSNIINNTSKMVKTRNMAKKNGTEAVKIKKQIATKAKKVNSSKAKDIISSKPGEDSGLLRTQQLLSLCRPCFVRLENKTFVQFQNKKAPKSKVPSLQQLINKTFKNACKEFQKQQTLPKIGDFIMGHMKGYCPWPAEIISFTKNGNRVGCYFYGTHNTGSVNIDKLILFKDGFEVIRLINIRNPNRFRKAVMELETAFGIPQHLSSLRENLTLK